MLSTCSELACPPESMVQKQWQKQNVVGKKKGLKKGSNTKLKTAKLQIESSRKIVEGSLRLTIGLGVVGIFEKRLPVTVAWFKIYS